MPTQALIFANGDPNDGALVQRTLAAATDALVIAADAGARNAHYFKLTPDVVIGDMDSLTEPELAELAAAGVEIKRYPRDKNETDLELALHAAADRGATWMRVLGGIGSRFDQTLANVYLMALPVLADCDVRLVAGKQEARLLPPGEWVIDGAPGDTVSLIPLTGIARGVRTHALYYPLRDEDLHFGPARGVSNVMNSDTARVSLQEGVLLLVYTMGRA